MREHTEAPKSAENESGARVRGAGDDGAVATRDLAGQRRTLVGLQRAAGNAAVARAVAAPKADPAPHGVQRFAAGPSGHGGVEEGGDAAGHSGAIEEVFGADRARDVYFGNFLRDMSQLDKGGVWSRLVEILALGEFGPAVSLQATEGSLGGYVPSEHLDNPEGGGSVEDPDVAAGRSPMTETTDQHLSGAQRREQQIDQRPEVQAEIRNRTRISGLPEYIERGKLHSKRKLRQAIHNGETPLGMMQMGDALHAVEDYFSHSNFVEACIQTLSDRGDPRVAPLMRQLAQVHLADRPDLLFPRDDHGTIQIQTGTYATDEDHSISMLELLSTELQHGYMVRYALLGWFRWMERQGANVGEQLLAAAGGGVGGAIGGVVGGIGGGVAGAVGGAGRGLAGGAAGGYDAGYRAGGGGVTGTALGILGGGLGAIGGAVSGLFGGAAEGAREGAESGQATGSRLGSAAGGAVGRVTGAALATLVATLPVGVLLTIASGLMPVIVTAIAAAHAGIVDRFAQRKVAESGRKYRAAHPRDATHPNAGGPTHSELAKDDPDHPLFGIATGMAYLADHEIAEAMRDAWERNVVHHTAGGAVPMPDGGSPDGGQNGGGGSSTTTPVPPATQQGGGTGGPVHSGHRSPKHPGEGPAFFAEVDKRFWAKTHYKVGGRLDPKNPADRKYIRIWLLIRDQVRAEREQAARQAQAQAPVQTMQRSPDGGGIGGVETEAEWIPDDHEETPVERGVTDLVDKYVCHPNQTEWWVDAVLTPPRRGT